MGTNRKISEATGFQELRDILTFGLSNRNMATKDVWSAQNSLIDPSVSTAGEYTVGGVVCTNAASSSAFTLTDTTIPIGGAANFVLCFDAAGAGTGIPTDVLTSAQVSTAGYTTAALALADASNLFTWPTIPTTKTPVGIYTVIAGSVSHVSGSSSFSLVTSAGGSHLFTNILTYVKP